MPGSHGESTRPPVPHATPSNPTPLLPQEAADDYERILAELAALEAAAAKGGSGAAGVGAAAQSGEGAGVEELE